MASKSKGHRQGGKFTGSHTTVADGTERIVDYIAAMPRVTKITLGRIVSGGRSAEGIPRVTCAHDPLVCVLVHVTITKGSVMQELHVWLVHPKTKKCFFKVAKWLQRREQRGR